MQIGEEYEILCLFLRCTKDNSADYQISRNVEKDFKNIWKKRPRHTVILSINTFNANYEKVNQALKLRYFKSWTKKQKRKILQEAHWGMGKTLYQRKKQEAKEEKKNIKELTDSLFYDIVINVMW